MRPSNVTCGTRVRLAADCPIDFEGRGPVPGDIGQVVALSGGTVKSGVVAVSFERLASHWVIPTKFLEHLE